MAQPLLTPSVGKDEDQYLEKLNSIYYHLRITFSDQTEKHEYLDNPNMLGRYKAIGIKIKEILLNYAQYGKITGGLETKNKVNEHTRAHLHFTFASSILKDTILKPIKRLLRETYDMETKGNKFFYFKPWIDPDINRAWRYCLKQSFVSSLCAGFPQDKLQVWHQAAHESYLVTIQVNQKKMDNRDTSDTLFERLCEVLKKDKLTNYQKIVSRAIRFYVDEKRPLNRTVITGYALTYQVMEGYKTEDSLSSEWCKM